MSNIMPIQIRYEESVCWLSKFSSVANNYTAVNIHTLSLKLVESETRLMTYWLISKSHLLLLSLSTLTALPPSTPASPSPGTGYCPFGNWDAGGDNCFLFEPDKSFTWAGASAECESRATGAKLASIADEAENWFVQTSLKDKQLEPHNRRAWFGLYQRQEGVCNIIYYTYIYYII